MRKWVINGALSAGSTFFIVILLESALRLAGFSYVNFYTYDAATGARLRPNAEGRWHDEGTEYIRINGDGLRSPEVSKQKPAGTVRIAVLGDSYAEAFQVPMEKTFWSVLERQLNSCGAFGPRRVEVINFGVSGYGTAQELMMLRNYVWDYSPDIILLAFLTGNDVRNNSKALEPGKTRPFFVYEGNSLRLDDSFKNSKEYKRGTSFLWKSGQAVVQYSRLLQLVMKAKELIGRQASSGAASGGEAGLDDAVYSEPKDPDWENAWKITEALFLMITDFRDRYVDNKIGPISLNMSTRTECPQGFKL